MFLSDVLTIDAVRKTEQGFLIASVRAARTGIQQYRGVEVDPDNTHGLRDRTIVNVYRPPEEVFSRDSLRSFSVLDVTVDHPPQSVTADNWKQYAVGVTGEEVVRDGEYIRIPMMLKDADAIRVVEDGKRELSVGYSAEIVVGDGVTDDGLRYDAKQTIIRANHLSIVGMARGGPKLRIGDSRTMKTIVHDGISIEFPDQAADAYNTLAARVAKLTADAATAKATADAAVAAADAKAAKAEAERDAALAKVMDDASVDKRVAARADLIATARAIHDADYTGMTDADIRKTVVVAKRGVEATKDKSAAYIDAAYDILVEDAKAHDGVRKAISTGSTAPSLKDGDKLVRDAHAAMVRRLTHPNEKTAA